MPDSPRDTPEDDAAAEERSAPETEASPEPMEPDPALSATKTRLNPRWLVKMAVFFAGVGGLGAWAVYDGLVAFPARGRESASFAEMQYLQAIRDTGQLAQAAIESPRQTLADLRARRSALLRTLDSAQTAGRLSEAGRTALEIKRLDWLESLSRIGAVSPQRTLISDPLARLADLERQWQGRSAPKNLSAYDIPSQWAIAGACALGLAWMLFLVGKAAGKTHRFDADALALTLPNGRTITPADIEEFDKRQWHKYFVSLRLRDGSAVRLDLFRYFPLESWILAIEKHVAPSDTSEQADSPSTQGESESAGVKEDSAGA